MVKHKNSGKTGRAQGEIGGKSSERNTEEQRRTMITPETAYGECSERLTAFGGLLALVKFLDLIGFEKEFGEHYVHPNRTPQLGGYRMVLGMLMLLFIGFQRLGHFAYVRTDAMVCGILRVRVLPAVSTFWRYLASLGIIQSASLLRLGAALRRRVWALCDSISTRPWPQCTAPLKARARDTTRSIAASKGCARYCVFWKRRVNTCAGASAAGRRCATRRLPGKSGNFASSYPSRCGRCTCAATVSSSAGTA